MELLELVTTLRDRYQVYAGEYKKPDLNSEIAVQAGHVSSHDDLDDIVQLMAETLPSIEFLVHKNCFHPDIWLWYDCQDTTSAEVVVLLNECIVVLTGAKQCPSEKNNASSVSIVPES